MIATLVLTDEIYGAMEAASLIPLETAGVLLASLVRAPNGDMRLLAKEMCWVPDDAYLERRVDSLLIASHGYVPALGKAEQTKTLPIWFHTHPSTVGHPTPSLADQKVDREIGDLFRLRSGAEFYATLIVSPRDGGIAFTGALHAEHCEGQKIDRLWRVGDHWRLTQSFDAHVEGPASIFDRSVRAFGPAIQQVLGDLRVAIVGCGGTGSAVAEQLVRLGVRHFTLVDADTLTESNVTRVYGSTPDSVGRAKTEVLAEHLRRIAPDVQISLVTSMVTLQPAAKQLVGCDLIFGCTDDNAGRLVLSRLSTFLAVPVIDIGVMLSTGAGGLLAGIDGRITILSPGAACLVCRGRVDLARAATELMTPDERKRLEDEGYAPALGRVEPAVVTFTTGVASAAITEMLERLIGFGPNPRPSEVLLRWHEREISTNQALPRMGHYCHPDSQKIAKGATEPFLEQAWPEL